mgnify:FL=1
MTAISATTKMLLVVVNTPRRKVVPERAQLALAASSSSGSPHLGKSSCLASPADSSCCCNSNSWAGSKVWLSVPFSSTCQQTEFESGAGRPVPIGLFKFKHSSRLDQVLVYESEYYGFPPPIFGHKPKR